MGAAAGLGVEMNEGTQLVAADKSSGGHVPGVPQSLPPDFPHFAYEAGPAPGTL